MQGTIYEFDALPAFGKNAPQDESPATPRVRRAVPLVGIIRNPRSHRNKGVTPEMAECYNILTETPRTREELHHTLAGFERRGIDYLVVDGGDGTVRDVLTCGGKIFGEEWPALIVLPKGKTNALTEDLGLPNQWSLADALAAAHRGRTAPPPPPPVTPTDNAGELRMQGFILGTGAFSIATEAGQEAHRRGVFNSFAVGLTILWGIFQTLFGRSGNPWRKCTPTRITDRGTGTDLPHPGPGRADERYLAIATTFEKFPLGARPFGRDPAPGLKLAVIDWPVRWMMALLPAILFGLYGRVLARNGAQRFRASELELEIGGSFILDGEAFPGGGYVLDEGPLLTFVVP